MFVQFSLAWMVQKPMYLGAGVSLNIHFVWMETTYFTTVLADATSGARYAKHFEIPDMITITVHYEYT